MIESANSHQFNSTFDATLAEPCLLIVEFGASTCSLCRYAASQLEAIVNALPSEKQGFVRLLHIDVHENIDLAKMYDIEALPVIIIFDRYVVSEYRYDKPFDFVGIRKQILSLLDFMSK